MRVIFGWGKTYPPVNNRLGGSMLDSGRAPESHANYCQIHSRGVRSRRETFLCSRHVTGPITERHSYHLQPAGNEHQG